MQEINHYVIETPITYTATASVSAEYVKALAAAFGQLPGLSFDDSLTVTDSYYFCKAFVVNSANQKVICVHNYGSSTANRQGRGIGYSFVDSNGNPINSVGATANINNVYGQYWYLYSYSSVSSIKIYYVTVGTRVLFNVTTDIAAGNPLYSECLDSFIDSLRSSASTQLVTHPTCFRYLNGSIGWSSPPCLQLTTRTSSILPKDMRAANKWYYFEHAPIFDEAIELSTFGAFSGLQSASSIYTTITANNKTFLVPGLQVSNNWMPMLDIT